MKTMAILLLLLGMKKGRREISYSFEEMPAGGCVLIKTKSEETLKGCMTSYVSRSKTIRLAIQRTPVPCSARYQHRSHQFDLPDY